MVKPMNEPRSYRKLKEEAKQYHSILEDVLLESVSVNIGEDTVLSDSLIPAINKAVIAGFVDTLSSKFNVERTSEEFDFIREDTIAMSGKILIDIPSDRLNDMNAEDIVSEYLEGDVYRVPLGIGTYRKSSEIRVGVYNEFNGFVAALSLRSFLDRQLGGVGAEMSKYAIQSLVYFDI